MIFLIVLIGILFFPVPVIAQEATIPPQSAWVDFGRIIEPSPFRAGWDTFFEGITPGEIVKKGDTYYLYYIGADDYISQKDNIGPSRRSVGVATSIDGVNWIKSSANPILTFTSSGNPEEGAVSVGVTIDASGTFHAYYGTNIASNPTTNSVNANVRYATSTNGINFTDRGTVLSYTDSRIWGYGDELHANMARFYNGVYYAYYIPNGTSVSRMQGVAWGSSPSTLTNSGPLTENGATVLSGAGSVVPLSPTKIAYFLTRSGVTTVRTASASNPTILTTPIQTYTDTFSGKVLYLDTLKKTWFMVYDAWSYMGLKTAPAGPIDTSGPLAPPNFRSQAVNHSNIVLNWDKATDQDTGVVQYVITRNGTTIATTKKLTFTDTGLTERTQYTYSVKAVNYHNINGSATSTVITTPADTIPPSIQSITSTNPTHVSVVFKEAVTRESAETVSNYSANNSLGITGAVLAGDGKTVTLTTGTQITNLLYTITASNIVDRATIPNSVVTTSFSFTANPIAGLVGYYRLDTVTNGLLSDTSGFANNGSLKGSPVTTTGKLGSAVNFDGINDYGELSTSAHIDSAFSRSFTVTAWVKPANIPPNTTASNGAYTVFSGPNIHLYYNATQKFTAGLKLGSSNPQIVSPIQAPGTWRHLSMVADDINKKLYLYINGVGVTGSPLTYSGTLPQLPRAINGIMEEYYSHFRIGSHDPLFDYESNYFNGAIDDVRIYAKALSTTEIAQVYAMQEATPPAGTKPGDANGDNIVDGRDYIIWLLHYGQNVSGASNGDFDANGVVDGRDYVVWLINYGR